MLNLIDEMDAVFIVTHRYIRGGRRKVRKLSVTVTINALISNILV